MNEEYRDRQLEDVDLFYEKMVTDKNWDETVNNFETQRRLDLIFKVLLRDRNLKNFDFLDAGSGGGHFSARACALGARVTSLDVGESLLDQVRAKCDSTTVVGDLMALPFGDQTFDYVMSTEVIEHTPDPKHALTELARVVKPNGTLIVTTPCKLWQPVVRAASVINLRPYQGRENFLWPRIARHILRQNDIDVTFFRGFNLLPFFSKSMSLIFDVTDPLGVVVPELFVNFAVMGKKRVSSE